MSRYGIHHSLSEGPDGCFRSNTTLLDEVKDNISNWLMTNRGDRIMRPTFGANLKSFLFQPLTDDLKKVITDVVASGIARIFPYVRLTQLSVTSTDQKLSLHMTIEFRGQLATIEQDILKTK